jgi:hypothetical protein
MTFKRIDPPRTNAKIHIDQAWHRLLNMLSSTLGGAGIANVFYVSKDGDNDTAQPNSMVFKYLTVQAAVTAAAALSGSVVYVGPGDYVESVLVPNGATNFSIVGESKTSTSITAAAAGQSALTLAPTLTPIESFGLYNIRLNGTLVAGAPAGGVLTINGGNLAGGDIFTAASFIDNVYVQNSSTGPAIVLTRASFVVASNSFFLNTPAVAADIAISLVQSGGVTFTESNLNRVSLDYDSANPVGAGGSHTNLNDCVVNGGIVQLGDGTLQMFGGTVTIGNLAITAALEADMNDTNVGVSGLTGIFQSDDVSFDGDVTLQATYGAASAAPTANQSVIRGGSINGDLTVIDVPGVVVHAPRIHNVDLLGNVVASASFPDIRGSRFEQANLSVVGIGAIDRDYVRIPVVTLPVVPGAVIVPASAAPIFTNDGGGPFPPYVAGNYAVLVEPNMNGGVASVTWNIYAKSETGFSGEGFVGGAANDVTAGIFVTRMS